MVYDKLMTLYFTIAIPTIYDQRRAWPKKKKNHLACSNYTFFATLSFTPTLYPFLRHWRLERSRMPEARGGSLTGWSSRKSSKREVDDPGATFSSGLPNSSGYAAIRKSEFNIECFYKIFSDLAKGKKCQMLVHCEQNFIFSLMLLNGTPLSGYNQGGDIKKRNLPCVISWLIRTVHDYVHVPVLLLDVDKFYTGNSFLCIWLDKIFSYLWPISKTDLWYSLFTLHFFKENNFYGKLTWIHILWK